ncbi:MFS transporter [Candidatus Peregrinibacteria bacterium CG_4_10_14_0_2_um_filter_43_11]|nr:MAG: MFS transporter [Candidatus Peregrinibacteria bacterium CG_4_10_14_0_2_um_filter_43_11]
MNQSETKKTIRVFGLASFLNDFGSDMIYPIWPLFVTSVLGADMAILGLVDGLGEAIVSISQAISGYISDKTKKRKIFVWIGYFMGSLSRIGYALSGTWHYLIPFKILDRAGKMRGAPRDAIIADISVQENRGRNFGFLRSMDHLGAVFGIVFCILFFKFLGYRNLFLIAAIPSLIGGLLILVGIKEKKAENIRIYKGFSFRHSDKNFKLFLVLSAFFAIGSFSYSFLLIFAKTFGFGIAFVPVLYLIFTLIASVFSLPFGKLADKIGRKKILFLGYFFWGLTCIGFIFSHNHWGIIATFILYGLHKGALEPVQKTFVSELVPEKYRGGGLGGYQMTIGLCALPASLIAGILWDKINIFAPFYFSLGLTVLSVIMLLFIKEKK